MAVAGLAACTAAAGSTLVLTPAGDISGLSGATVGWGFTITNTGSNWIEVTSAAFCTGTRSGVQSGHGHGLHGQLPDGKRECDGGKSARNNRARALRVGHDPACRTVGRRGSARIAPKDPAARRWVRAPVLIGISHLSYYRFMVRSALLLVAVTAAAAPKMLLRQGWSIQSSAEVRETGDTLSTSAFQPRGWYRATLPSTVLGALVASHVYPDPYFGMNLRSISGTSYPIGMNFSNLPMPPESPFRHSWWYRTDFKLPAAYQGQTVWLGFDGINFRANVWLNGRRIASADKMAGAWRLFEFDVTAAAKPGDTNSLAIEIFPSLPHDLAITFVDWNPQPPDKNMGLWRDVYVTATGPVAVRFPAVATRLNLPANDLAQLTVKAELKNAARQAVDGVLKGKIEDIEFSQPVRLGPGETRVVRFTLELAHPRLWWPAETGQQNLYPLDVQFEANGRVSDSSHIDFGIREVTSEIDEKGHRLFHINGKNILIRGAGYTFDMLLRASPERQEAELKYVRDMHLNAVRFEGKLEDDHFLELCDRYGILVMAGWCCCDHWEQWQQWDQEDESIAAESLRDQLRRLARHPSVFDWLYGSDNPPPPNIEKLYLGIIKETEWPNPTSPPPPGSRCRCGSDRRQDDRTL